MTEPQQQQQQSVIDYSNNIDRLDEHQNTSNYLVCHWNQCLKIFPNHATLASHLSEDHVGWKKGGYYCDWSNCARQGAKCHNRFALMMHLRIHTGEKPFECNMPNCGQTFGRMDALVRHKKAEHGEGSLDKPTNSNNKSTVAPTLAAHHTTSNTPTPTPTQPTIPTTIQTPNTATKPIKRAHSKTSLDLLSKKRSRTNNITTKKPRGNSGWYSSGDESEDSLAQQVELSKQQKLLSGSADYNQYRLAKAQLHYILRENEMLQDEFDSAQKKLKRMRTERRVLLDAVMTAEQSRSNGYRTEAGEEDPEVETVEEDNFIPNDQ